jgi:light-regulated signal transduction histidine kinase (bacteriophytochrome)
MAVAIEVTEQVLARQKIEEMVTQRTKELAEANEALLRSNEELARSNVNLEEFAYAASHDLKEPVRKIQIFIDRLKGNLNDRIKEDEKHYFDRVERSSKRMSSLIDDLLSYSRVSIRPRTFEKVDLNQLIDLVLSDLDFEIEEMGAMIVVDKLFIIKGHQRQLQRIPPAKYIFL